MLEWGRVSVPGPSPRVKLEDVDLVGREVVHPLLEVAAQVRLTVPLFGDAIGSWWPWSGGGRRLGRDMDLSAASGFEEFSNDPFALAPAITRGGVDEIHTEVEGLVEGGEGVVFRLWPPASAKGPCAKSNLRNLKSMLAKRPKLHEGMLPLKGKGKTPMPSDPLHTQQTRSL